MKFKDIHYGDEFIVITEFSNVKYIKFKPTYGLNGNCLNLRDFIVSECSPNADCAIVPKESDSNKIKLELDSPEELILLWHRLNLGKYSFNRVYESKYSFISSINNIPLFLKINKLCESLNIDPQIDGSIKIDNRIVEFKENSIKIGCTEVDKETIRKIAEKMGLFNQSK